MDNSDTVATKKGFGNLDKDDHPSLTVADMAAQTALVYAYKLSMAS